MKNPNEVIIVIPMYKKSLEWYEKISLQRAIHIFKDRKIVFLSHEELEIDHRLNSIEKVNFDPDYFKSIKSYNRLMLSVDFYNRFLEYDYILIYQLDAFVFSDSLDEFCQFNYDYIGAPLLYDNSISKDFENHSIHTTVGNGGLSLRNVSACINVLNIHSNNINKFYYNEDRFFPMCGILYPDVFKVAPFDIAVKFAFEWEPDLLYKYNSFNLPFGCHGWMKYNPEFYKDRFIEAGINICEYDYKALEFDLVNERRNFIYRQFYSLCTSSDLLTRVIQSLLPSENGYYIFGGGKMTEEMIPFINSDIITIHGIFDDDEEKYGNSIYGYRIYKPDFGIQHAKIIVFAKYKNREIELLLKQEGLKSYKDYLLVDNLVDDVFACGEMSIEEVKFDVDLYYFFIRQLDS